MTHRRPHPLVLRLVAIALPLGLGCTKTQDPPPDPVDPTADTAPPPEQAPPEQAPPEQPLTRAVPPPPQLPPAQGEAAYFIIEPKRLARLDDGGFAAIPVPQRLSELQIGPDGALFARGFDTVYTLDDGRLRPMTAPLDEGMQAFFVASNEDIWATQMAGVFHWDGSQWRPEPVGPVDAMKQDFRVGGQPTSVVVDREQRVWLTTYRDLMVREGTEWRTIPRRSLGGRPDRLHLDPDGAAQLELKSHKRITLPLGAKGRGRTIAAKNVAWTLGGGNKPWTVVWVKAGGRRKTFRVGRDIEGITPSSAVVDTRGRLWVGTAAGVTIIAPDGTTTFWPMGTVPQLAGWFYRLAVDGAGPAELPAAGPPHLGGARGRLIGEIGPEAGVAVELCAHPLALTLPPCTRSRPSYPTTTDPEGYFEIRDLPIGAYEITVDQGETWRIVFREERFVIAEGEPTNLGDIDATRGMIVRPR